MNTFKILSSVSILALMVTACTAANTDTEDVAGEQDSSAESEAMMIEDEDPSNDDDDMIAIEEEDDAPKTEDAGGNGMTAQPPMPRTVKITADNWSFCPQAVTACVGEEVYLTFVGAVGSHGFSIPDLGVNFPVAPGQNVSVKLPTDKAGTFGFKCSVPCGAGHKEMKGTITVE